MEMMIEHPERPLTLSVDKSQRLYARSYVASCER